MRPQTLKIRELIRSKPSAEEKLKALHNAYTGEDAFIISCGPSVLDLWRAELRAFLADKLVIGIKQAYELAPELYDFHIINCVHHKPYRPAIAAIRIRTTWARTRCDLHLPITNPNNYAKCLAVTGEYDRWTLDRSPSRPWGVGVMHEVGIYLPIHFGCRSLTVLGWDLQGNHFYATNQPTPINETRLILASAPLLENWMQERKCPIRLYSPRSCLPFRQIAFSDLIQPGAPWECC